jgi:hypothetical protein
MSDVAFAGLENVVVENNPAATRAFRQINECLVRSFGRGATENRAITAGMLSDLGLVDAPTDPSAPLPPGPSLNPSIPPPPSGLSAYAGVATVVLQWDEPTFNYFGHTEVWRSIANDLTTSVYVGETISFLYADNAGAGGISYFYWIRHVSQAGNKGQYNAVSGVAATTGQAQTGDIANGAVDTLKIANAAIVEALIANLAVTTAKIQNLAVTDAKILSLAVSKLVAGAIAINQYIQSSNYVTNVSGFKINWDGFSEFQNIKARGDIQASSIVASVSILAPAISGGTFTGGTFTGNTFDGGLFVAGTIRSNVAMSTYTTPAGSRVGSVSGYTYEIYLGATGAALAGHVNGRYRWYADGVVEMDNVLIRNNNVIASGSGSISNLEWTPAAVYDPGFGGGP